MILKVWTNCELLSTRGVYSSRRSSLYPSLSPWEPAILPLTESLLNLKQRRLSLPSCLSAQSESHIICPVFVLQVPVSRVTHSGHVFNYTTFGYIKILLSLVFITLSIVDVKKSVSNLFITLLYELRLLLSNTVMSFPLPLGFTAVSYVFHPEPSLHSPRLIHPLISLSPLWAAGLLQ